MNKMDLILLEWDFCFEKEDWYPPLSHALQGVTEAQADWRPEGTVNTIRENVHHLTFYKERLLKRLKGEESLSLDFTNDDTFAAPPEGKQTWQETVSRLKAVHTEIRDILSGLNEEDFDRPLPKNPLGLSVTSLIMHDAYHTGQIVQIRKLQDSWPSRRSFE